MKRVLGFSALMLPAVAMAQADYSGLTIDLSGVDAAIIGIGTAVLGALGVILAVKLAKRAAS